MKIQIIPALTFLFFIVLISYVNLQITPTQYGLQVSFGQDVHPETHYSTTMPVIADGYGDCYSIKNELEEQNIHPIHASIEKSIEHDRAILEMKISTLITSNDPLRRLDILEPDRILP